MTLSDLLRSSALLAAAVLVTGCAASLKQPVADQRHLETTETPSSPERQPPPVAKTKLGEDILFKLLVAEIAGQRNKVNTALEHYQELAHATRDPIIIARAAQIALYMQNDAATHEFAKLWNEVDPYNPDANQILTVLALRRGDIEQALSYARTALDSLQGTFAQKLWTINDFLVREQNRTNVLRLLERLLKGHTDDADSLYAFAHITARMGALDRSETLLKRVLEIKPGDKPAIFTYTSLLQQRGAIDEALDLLEKSLNKEAGKNDFTLRMRYAHLLAETQRFDDAHRQFEILSARAPDNTEVLYALGLLYMQDDQLDKAEQYFIRLSKLNQRVFEASYYLGRIAESREHLDKAREFYRTIQGGENYFDAQIRLNLILAKQNAHDKALAGIRAIERSEGADHIALIQAETEILSRQKRYEEAMAVFNEAIKERETAHPDLLYSRAMLAEKMGRLNILEADLRAILAKDENNATALNALGYTLADRTDRYDEAYSYINHAYKLKPDDFYILDSMGWVLYRLGRLEEAVDFLRKALGLKNDPEIAAHLGEVLWVMGDRKAARAVWETALKNTPEDNTLLEVIERFKP